jgi:hypothetical protein
VSVGLGPSVVTIGGGGTVASTDITDSTATGRAVITAASATAARSAISAASSPSGVPALPTTSLVADFDASTLSLGTVSSWASSVGTFTAVQATGSKQPVATDCAVGLHRGVVFDGTNDILAIAHEAALDWSTLAVYVVCAGHRDAAANNVGADGLVIGRVHTSLSSPWFRWSIRQTNATSLAVYLQGSSTGGSSIPDSGSLDVPRLLHLAVGSSGAFLKVDGQHLWNAGGSTSITYPEAQKVTFGGADYGTQANFFRGAIARVLIYGNVTQTAATRRDVERYLCAQYDITPRFTSYG